MVLKFQHLHVCEATVAPTNVNKIANKLFKILLLFKFLKNYLKENTKS